MTKQLARIVAVTRRYVTLRDNSLHLLPATLTSKVSDQCVGDLAKYTESSGDIVVEEIQKRKNCLQRSYGQKSKLLASNVDHLFIITAPFPLCNPSFIDRIIASATIAKIPFSLLVNKSDLEGSLAESQQFFDVYRELGYRILYTSAKLEEGITELQTELQSDAFELVVFAGVSGVGKSSLLHRLLPDIDIDTQEVSEKTGQGRQTTSLAIAHPLQKNTGETLYVVDLPGIQSFGVSHLTLQELEHSFIEFGAYRQNCRFQNCMHTEEPDCAVQQALKKKDIADFRYQNYCSMREEIISHKPY